MNAARAQRALVVLVVVLVLVAAGTVGTVLGLRVADSGDSGDSGDSDAAGASATPTGSTTPSASASASASPSSAQADPSDPAATEAPEADLARFYTQRLSWSSCRNDFQCATLTVPLDYEHPNGRTIELAVLEAPATDQSARVGSLVVNPGGPGGSGTDYAAGGGFYFGDALRKSYDIVGFDPRGVGESTAVDCLTDAQLDRYVAVDPVPATKAEIGAYEHQSALMAQGCATNSPRLSGHVSTVEAARDMDILRAALGETQLDYLGASYGTKLGTVYADLFPAKVGRFVLDGALPPSLGTVQLNLQQAKGFEVALRSYVKDCVDDGGCYLGASVDAGVRRVQRLMDHIENHPLPTSDGRELEGGNAFAGLITPLYSKDNWPLLTSALKQALKGDGSALMTLSDAYASRGSNGYSDNSMEANWAINCLDDPTSLTVAQVRKQLPRFEKAAPTFGAALAWMTTGCAGEQKKAEEKAPAVGAPGANPIVVVGTTRDPATPYAWAKELAAALDSGVLVSRDGDGHTGYHSGNSCVDDAVEGYLIDGTVPQDGLSC
ncbi:MAG: alpha/beta hydrolase [Nocardioides sp.]|uniref:alpha/beta hydrolase n=1 Tax=Nocardioides sp. TaxID=35761 RepID=UPI0039E4C2D8